MDAALEFEYDGIAVTQKEEPHIRDAGVYDVTRNVIMETRFRSISSLAIMIARNMMEKFDKALGVVISIKRKQLFIPGNVDSSEIEISYSRADFEAEKK